MAFSEKSSIIDVWKAPKYAPLTGILPCVFRSFYYSVMSHKFALYYYRIYIRVCEWLLQPWCLLLLVIFNWFNLKYFPKIIT